MKSYFIGTQTEFSGEMLLPHWAKEKYKIFGDYILSFAGQKKQKSAKTKNKKEAPAKTPLMLHFIIEHNHLPKSEAILRQRLFLTHVHQALGGSEFIRKFSTIYFLSQPITHSNLMATPFSCVIHSALLVDPEFLPYLGVDLDFMDIPVKDLAIKIMHAYKEEVAQLEWSDKDNSIAII